MMMSKEYEDQSVIWTPKVSINQSIILTFILARSILSNMFALCYSAAEQPFTPS